MSATTTSTMTATTPVIPMVTDAATLPVMYINAAKALAECDRIDECQDWADKAAALASYAKQADDETLHRYADRIKARAIRRCGVLAKRIEPARGANQNIREGDRPKVGRQAAANGAGLSRHQLKQAIRVANVPHEDFERQVESDKPPTITALAQQGTKPLKTPAVQLPSLDEFTRNLAEEWIGILKVMAGDADPAALVDMIVTSRLSARMQSVDLHAALHWLTEFARLWKERQP